ncbi:MAG: ABC transporter substrate-binding protein [Candidatus Hodarchaeales archaeon]
MNKKILFGIFALILVPMLVSSRSVVTPNVVPRFEQQAYTTIDIYYNLGNTVRETACTLLKDAIEALDIDGDGTPGDIEIVVHSMPWADYLNALSYRDQIGLYILGWAADYADPDDYIVPFLGGNIGGIYAYWNSYSNPDIDNWIDEAVRTADRTAREAYYAQIEAQAAQDVAFVPLYQANDIRVERDEVDGYVYNPMTTSGNDLFYLLSKNAATETDVSTIVKESFGGPQYLDPGIDYETNGWEVIQNTYETLITFKDYWKSDEFMPLLASKMPVWNEAGDSCNISLKTGITFHDGTPFNASCVKYSFDRAVIINDPNSPNWMWGGFVLGGSTYMGSSGTEADVMTFINGPDGDPDTPDQFTTVINDTCIQIKLDSPYTAFESILAHSIASIISPTFDMAHLSGITDDTNMTESMILQANADPGYMANHTCGTGPYELVEWDQSTHVEMAAFNNYWGTAPSITNVTIIWNADTSSRVSDIANGIVDIIKISAAESDLVSYESGDYDTWGDPANEIYSGVNVTVGLPSWSVISLFMNHALEPFDDVNARLGIAYAFPYDQFIETTLRGHGTPMHGTIPSGMLGHVDAFPYVYNETKAIECFRAAGLGMPDSTTTSETTTTTTTTTATTVPSDTIPPTITNVFFEPFNPVAGETIDINADIYDTSGISSVVLYYWVDSGIVYSSPMILKSGITWSATIGPFAAGSVVSFSIEAIDNSAAHNAVNSPNIAFVISEPASSSSSTSSAASTSTSTSTSTPADSESTSSFIFSTPVIISLLELITLSLILVIVKKRIKR